MGDTVINLVMLEGNEGMIVGVGLVAHVPGSDPGGGGEGSGGRFRS